MDYIIRLSLLFIFSSGSHLVFNNSVQASALQNRIDLCVSRVNGSLLIEFHCDNNKCIDKSLICNNVDDCGDASDELICCTDGFQCRSDQKCLQKTSRCDGIQQCTDGSDEHGCGSNCLFSCLADGKCLRDTDVCNGYEDCSDGSDERVEGRCGFCDRSQFQCVGSKKCISWSLVCDMYPDCEDESDEDKCPCTATEFKCRSGECISLYSKCDYITDCKDGSDESDCEYHTLTSLGITVSIIVSVILFIVFSLCLFVQTRNYRRRSRQQSLTGPEEMFPSQGGERPAIILRPPSYAEAIAAVTSQPPPPYSQVVQSD